MSHALQIRTLHYQGLTSGVGSSTRHERDMMQVECWRPKTLTRQKSDHLLRDLLFDDAGHRMVATHATKAYYVSQPVCMECTNCGAWIDRPGSCSRH